MYDFFFYVKWLLYLVFSLYPNFDMINMFINFLLILNLYPNFDMINMFVNFLLILNLLILLMRH